ncbi:unnamed protein product [Danaus chrysippus]|uniref:(African queen) hypothetical protein n=1 Tax=Danaus chrysippus TaxID=151541 RepID=A0A8J2QST7_9NEOP|nr:unnamed protein product [Danaus chrysippus]
MTELVEELEVYKKLDDRKQEEDVRVKVEEQESRDLLVETMIRTISPDDPTADRNRSKDSLARRYFILSIKHR